MNLLFSPSVTVPGMLLSPVTLEIDCALRTVILVNGETALSVACGSYLNINLNLTSDKVAGYH